MHWVYLKHEALVLVDGLYKNKNMKSYQRQGFPAESFKHNEAVLKAGQSKELKQPVPVVLHPNRYVLHSESDFAAVLSVQTIFLQT